LIFVAVGTQLPFDRMIRCVDKWAKKSGVDVVAQAGDSSYEPEAIESYKFISPNEFLQFQIKANILVGHAGMGTILSAMELGKPLIIMPRLVAYNEHRNDHQLATALKFKNTPGIYVAMNDNELLDYLNDHNKLALPESKISNQASQSLLNAIDHFIDSARD